MNRDLTKKDLDILEIAIRKKVNPFFITKIIQKNNGLRIFLRSNENRAEIGYILDVIKEVGKVLNRYICISINFTNKYIYLD